MYALTGGQVADAFVLGLAGASATALVAGVVAMVRWLVRLDGRLETIDKRVDESGLRTATIEREMFTNGGGSLRDVVDKVSESQDRMVEIVDGLSSVVGERGEQIAALESKVDRLLHRRRGTTTDG